MTLDPGRVNVLVSTSTEEVTIPKVPDVTACGLLGGWYYDNDEMPTRVLLAHVRAILHRKQAQWRGRRVRPVWLCNSSYLNESGDPDSRRSEEHKRK